MSTTEDPIVNTDISASDEAPPAEDVHPVEDDLLPTGSRLVDEVAEEPTEGDSDVETVVVEVDVPKNADEDSAPIEDLEVLGEDELFDEDVEAVPIRESAYDRPGNWYVVHTQSGYEKKVRQNLEARRDSMHLEDRILEVEIPMEDVDEFRNGKKVTVSKKVFPGYLLVRCYLDDESWSAIRDTPGIVNFVGAGGKPSRLSRKEVETFLPVADESETVIPKRSKARFGFGVGETVRVKEGPFADFSGAIQEINEDQLKVKVLVNIFGRETPVELEFAQIAQL
ncbi:MAG TPA: transcription termination/antitermination factor NusG [Acidimicrobiaceae bacterium]|nr:transcription termination/antitermination factor NusG [Acidimicrobiaceae bacterium]|tara:strand:+ start:75 stop:920 length:846 start_codon:yes stop_codon:yes gene_type:complete